MSAREKEGRKEAVTYSFDLQLIVILTRTPRGQDVVECDQNKEEEEA